MQLFDIIKVSNIFILSRRHTPMKSVNQIIEQRLHRSVRAKVRSCTQPGVVWNIIEKEMSMFLADLLQEKLHEEQEVVLQRRPYQRGGDSRKRNGFKPLRIKGLFSSIILRRPVLRGKTPQSSIISLFRSFGKGFVMLLATRFWLRGTSTRAVAQEINQLTGTKLSSSDISVFTDKVLPEALSWLNRPIELDVAYLFLDAIYLPVRKKESTNDQALLAAIGMSSTGQRKVLGFLLGDKESSDTWSAFIKDLLARGLKRENLKMVISDDHKAIDSAVSSTLGIKHQLCVIHKMRNALCRVQGKQRKAFYADFKAIYWAETKADALRAIGRLEATWGRLYPKATQTACAKPEAFLRFMDEPKCLWTILRSTNLIERFNRELRRRLNVAGAMQSENELNKLTWSISVEQEKRWAKRSVANVKELKMVA
jgi:transposase-like protein